MIVLSAELFNTALEAAIDRASPEHHPLAKVAKDTAAGAVLISAIGAVIVGVLIFLPRLLALIGPR
jgi:diacylglycerol kinase (ATP)